MREAGNGQDARCPSSDKDGDRVAVGDTNNAPFNLLCEEGEREQKAHCLYSQKKHLAPSFAADAGRPPCGIVCRHEGDDLREKHRDNKKCVPHRSPSVRGLGVPENEREDKVTQDGIKPSARPRQTPFIL